MMATDSYIPEVGSQNRIDNTPGKTMRGAISGLMGRSNILRIASGYFSLSGVVQLEDDFNEFFNSSENNKVKLLISNQYDGVNTDTRKILGIAEGIEKYDAESFYLDNEFYKAMVRWIKEGRIEVKIFVDSEFYKTHSKNDIAFLHGKAYLFSNKEDDRRGDVLIGSSNFTYGGLVKNRELNIFSQDSFPPIKEWFDEMWTNYSEKYSDELLEQFEVQKKYYAKPKISYTPITYLYWNLGKFYGKKTPKSLDIRIREIEKNLPYPKHKDGNKYFVHQLTGIKHVYTQIKKFDTQILADGVGLGKTLEAASIIKLYLQDLQVKNDGRKILILANDRLKEQWLDELSNVKVDPSKIDIITRQKFTGMDDSKLKHIAESYALFVIDEAHEGFLSRKNKAYIKVREVIKIARDIQGRTVRGLLLTATPWNNSREDIIRLGLLFLNIQKVPHDRVYFDYLLTNREKLLYDTNDSGNYNHKAYVQFWQDLFYQRTRTSLAREKYLSDRYPNRCFPLENEKEPFTLKYSSEVSKALTEILNRLIDLKLPYQDTVWQYFGSDTVSNIILRQRYMLLRRADSSNAAFGGSLKNIKNRLEEFQKNILILRKSSLAEIKKFFYRLVDEDYADNYSEDESTLDLGDSGIEDELNTSKTNRIRYINQKLTEQTVDMYLRKMLNDTMSDIQSMDEILTQWNIVSKDDEKQKIIVKQIKDIISKHGKVLVFSEFSDTVESYYRQMLQDPEILSVGVGMIHGNKNKINFEECTKEEVLGRFSPESKSYSLFDDEKEISVLIGTDAISTGQNLQDANSVITIELPYNPMRLEQRIGRIDRPKLHGENNIYIYAFPSEEIINAELKLSERFENKAKNAKMDTEGDFKLPFISNGKYSGVKSTVSASDESPNKETITASVEEEEAQERVFDFYREMGDVFPLNKKLKFLPYSFNNDSQTILLFKTVLRDINNNNINNPADRPSLWNISTNKKMSFVEAENTVKKLLDQDAYINEQRAIQLLSSVNKKKQLIIKDNVEHYNVELKSVSLLEVQPTNIAELRKILKRGMKEYRSNFKKQGVDGKLFNKIVDSLGNRGYNNEQRAFLKLLKDQDGKISTNKINESIWKNLSRFVTLFNTESLELVDNNKEPLRKANVENSSLEIIAGTIGVKQKA
mgnify:CR=1 FL=1